MTLSDLRRYAVRESARIHFTLDAAGECFVNEHGILKLPSLTGVPTFRVDPALPGVERFTIEPVRAIAKRQALSRLQLESLLAPSAPVKAAPEE